MDHEMNITTLNVDDIDTPISRKRAISPQDFPALENLLRDITVNGLQSPIGVKRQFKDGEETGRYDLIYGVRRLMAHRIGHLEKIEARVYDIESADKASLIEISENLMRRELLGLEETAHRVEYIRLMKKLGHDFEGIEKTIGVDRQTLRKDFKKFSAAAKKGAAKKGEAPISIDRKSSHEDIARAQEQAAPVIAEAIEKGSDRFVPVDELEPNTITVRLSTRDHKEVTRWFADHMGDGDKQFSPAFLRLLAYGLERAAQEYERAHRRAVVTNPV